MKRILIVDDLVTLLDEHIELLKDAGLDYEVKTADHPTFALELLEKERFDLAILDLNLPLKTGLELLHDIKRRYSATKIMIYSAYLQDITPETLMREGADIVLSKPAALDQFLGAISKLLYPESGLWVGLFNGTGYRKLRPQFIRQMIQRALKLTNNNVTEASALLGITRECLSRLMKKFGVIR